MNVVADCLHGVTWSGRSALRKGLLDTVDALKPNLVQGLRPAQEAPDGAAKIDNKLSMWAP